VSVTLVHNNDDTTLARSVTLVCDSSAQGRLEKKVAEALS
jgi:hypothetical protein